MLKKLSGSFISLFLNKPLLGLAFFVTVFIVIIFTTTFSGWQAIGFSLIGIATFVRCSFVISEENRFLNKSNHISKADFSEFQQ